MTRPQAVASDKPNPLESSLASDRRLLRFGDFELTAATGELERRERLGTREPVKLQPQPARALLFLAERPGTLVTRAELQSHLWGEAHYVDYEQGLNYCIRAIRRALGDDASAPRFLETVPRRGYRFVSTVEVAEIEPSDDARARRLSLLRPGRATTRAGTPSSGRTAIVLMAAAVVTLVLHWALSARLFEATAPPKLAVLPFDDHSSTQIGATLAASLTDELISSLAGGYADRLGVIARTSSLAYAGKRLTAAQIGKELNVDYLLTGGMQTSDGSTRISVQLIRVRDETNLWAETYDRQLERTDWDAWARTVSLRVAERLSLSPARLDAPGDTSHDRPASSSRTARGSGSDDVTG